MCTTFDRPQLSASEGCCVFIGHEYIRIFARTKRSLNGENLKVHAYLVLVGAQFEFVLVAINLMLCLFFTATKQNSTAIATKGSFAILVGTVTLAVLAP